MGADRNGRVRHRGPVRIGWLVAAAVVLAAALVVGGVVAAHRSDAPAGARAGSRLLATGTAVPDGAIPSTLHLVYEATDAGAQGDVVTTEEIWVRRPFADRREVRRGPPPGTATIQTEVDDLGRQRSQGTGAAQVLTVGPTVAPVDLRIDAVVADAIAAGTLVRREQRSVLGRPCQVLRAPRRAGPGALEPDPVDPDATTDLCVDGHGVLLEEITLRAGRVVHRRVATTVETDVPVEDARFAIPEPSIPVGKGGGSLRRLDPASRPPGADFYELGAPLPDGFALVGRYAVIPPQPQAASDPSQAASKQGGVVDLYRRGVDILVVDRSSTLDGSPTYPPDPRAAKVDLGPNGTGEAVLGLAGSTVRFTLPNAHSVRLFATLPLATLGALARTMAPQPPGQLRYLDPAP